MTETTPTTVGSTQSPSFPIDGRETTRELHTKSSTAEDDEIGDLLAELCDDTLTPAERLENQFTLSNQWAIPDEDLLESRILRVLNTDPRTDETEPETKSAEGADDLSVSVSLTDLEEEILSYLPGTVSEVTGEVGCEKRVVHKTISELQNKGFHIREDDETEMYVFQGHTPDIPDEGASTPNSEGSTEDDTMFVVYWLPSEDVAVEEFRKPIPWNPEKYKFARLVEAIGYGPSTLDQLEGETVVLENVDDDWKIPDPAENGVHPAAYTETPTPPPTSSFRTAARYAGNTVTESARKVVANQYIISTAGVIVGAALAYGLYLFGVQVGPIISSFPELFAEALASSAAEGSESSEEINQDLINYLESLMGMMIHLMIVFMVIHVTVFMIRQNS